MINLIIVWHEKRLFKCFPAKKRFKSLASVSRKTTASDKTRPYQMNKKYHGKMAKGLSFESRTLEAFSDRCRQTKMVEENRKIWNQFEAFEDNDEWCYSDEAHLLCIKFWTKIFRTKLSFKSLFSIFFPVMMWWQISNLQFRSVETKNWSRNHWNPLCQKSSVGWVMKIPVPSTDKFTWGSCRIFVQILWKKCNPKVLSEN